MSEPIHSLGNASQEPGDVITRLEIPSVVASITGRRPSPSAAYRLIRDGKIPAFRLVEGGQLYALRSEVEAYARRQVSAGASIRGRQAAAAVERIKGHRIRKDGGR